MHDVVIVDNYNVMIASMFLDVLECFKSHICVRILTKVVSTATLS